MQDQLNKIMLQLATFASVAEDVKIIKRDVGSLKESVEMAHERLNSFCVKVNAIEAQVVEVQKVAEEVPVLKEEINKLKQELRERDQWARANNVEIRGIPLKKNENLYEIINRITSLCNFSVRKEDINYIARIPTRSAASEKPIVVSLNNRYTKDEFVALARKNKELNLLNLGFGTAGSFYVNDHLTQFNKELLRRAKSLAKENNFQYVWVKYCKIMVRRTDSSPIIFIKSEKDLQKIT
ncbi:uncharacterized protein LOC132903298 [Amyelois transitella]|uniref:uncharacterized protein LOC132903298 n=1 Tax=Amyelois transitella TaxID=680683 RepID=UPI00298FDF63|nr:uncharacterized protein LOC132903298 [Amyelois transitella]